MPDGGAGRLDFSDLGGQRVADASGQASSGSFFSDFGDMGVRALLDPPDWLRQWPAPKTRFLDFSDLGGQRVTEPDGQMSITPTQPQRQGTPATPKDFSDIGGVRVSPPQPQKSTWKQLLDLNEAIDNAEMRTAAGAGKDLWEAAKGVGSLVKPPDFVLHPRDAGPPKTFGEALGRGLQMGAYTTGLTALGRAGKGYYDATRANIDRAEQAGQQGDYTGVAINSAAAALPLVGPLIGGLYEDAQTNPDPFTVIGKGISRIGQAASMAPERSFIPNPVRLVTKGAGRVLSKVADGTRGSPVGPPTVRDIPAETAEPEQTPAGTSQDPQHGRIAGPAKGMSRTSGLYSRLPASLQKLLEKINPTGDRAYNCGKCVDAFAQTLNGNESVAEEGNDIQVQHLEDNYGSFVDATLPEIEKELLAEGEGAHAIIKGEFKPSPNGQAEGHVFNAVHWNDGKVYFVDSQSGEAVTPEDLLLYARFQYVRSD